MCVCHHPFDELKVMCGLQQMGEIVTSISRSIKVMINQRGDEWVDLRCLGSISLKPSSHKRVKGIIFSNLTTRMARSEFLVSE